MREFAILNKRLLRNVVILSKRFLRSEGSRTVRPEMLQAKKRPSA